MDREYELTLAKDDLKEMTTAEIPMALADLLAEYESTNDQQLIGIIIEYLLIWSEYQQAAEAAINQR